jgi:hypothetical protein
MDGMFCCFLGPELGTAEGAMFVKSPDPVPQMLFKRKNRMTTQTRNKIDSIAFTGLLLALAIFLVWFFITIPGV